MDAPKDAAARAAARAGWPGLKTTLAEAPGDDLSASTTAEQRVAMVEELSVQAWSLTGRPFPKYTRAEMPGRIIRPGRP
ncbi:MAG: hypothetical protein FJ086_14130 [Deltaproteobacteria bacterium]|nr:hypothetical protein [Deltaproteobacteria bacterium]